MLDADPTVDIRNSDKVSRVMLGGRLYDAATMDEVETGTRKKAPYWWQASGKASAGTVSESHIDGDI